MTHPDWFQRVAHDLRDPLSPLQTAVYLLRSGEISDDDRNRMLELIERQGVRLAGMIDELSDCRRDAARWTWWCSPRWGSPRAMPRR